MTFQLVCNQCQKVRDTWAVPPDWRAYPRSDADGNVTRIDHVCPKCWLGHAMPLFDSEKKDGGT